MKKIVLFFFVGLLSTVSFAQKKEKIKGTKILKTERYDSDSFQEIEIEDNLEVYLIKGDKNSLEIETDDNLHVAIDHKTYGKTLRLNTNKDISGFKKLEVRVTYTDSLKLITVKHEAKLNATSDLQVNNITIKTFDYSKSLLNVNTPTFTLITNDKSEIDLKAKSEDISIEMSKSSEIKASLNCNKVKLDMYQKAEAVVDGNASEMKVRLDNNAKYNGKAINSKLTYLTAEGSSNSSVLSNGPLSISASGKAEVTIYGDPKIEIKKFADDATLYKKSK